MPTPDLTPPRSTGSGAGDALPDRRAVHAPPSRADRLLGAFLIAFFVGAIIFSLSDGYLLFHLLVEVFSVVVACAIFVVAWHSRRVLDNPFFLFLGIAYLSVAFLDLCHTATYESMGITLRAGPWVHPGADPAIEFWIAARYVESVSLVAALFFVRRRFSPHGMLVLYVGLTALIFASIYFWGIFPACFVREASADHPEPGLTTFKVVSEYVVSGLMAFGAVLLWRRRQYFPPKTLHLLMASMIITAVAELVFTFYNDMDGPFNVLGHFCKLLSFFLIYRATIQTGLEDPYALLWRNLAESERALRRERDFANAILDTAAALIVVVDPGGRIVRVNRACADLTGYTPEDLAGRPLLETLVPEEEAAGVAEAVRALQECPDPVRHENRIRTRTGEERRIAWSNTTLRDAEGAVEFIVGIGIDVTESRQAEAALLQQERMAAVGDLAAGVAHHFNNVHAGMEGYLELLAEDASMSEKNRRRLEIVRTSFHRATDVTRNLLRFAGKVGEGGGLVALNELAHDAVQVIEAAVGQDGVALDLDLQETPTIRGNAAELSQVIMNLLVNAWHAMLGSETRRLTVRTRLEGEQVVFAVEDTGCGIPAEYRERIFHPMFSLKGEHAPPGSPLADVRGTGLGLSLSATVVKAHGGELDIESEEGVGTTVTVRLPAAASGPDAPTATGTPDNL